MSTITEPDVMGDIRRAERLAATLICGAHLMRQAVDEYGPDAAADIKPAVKATLDEMANKEAWDASRKGRGKSASTRLNTFTLLHAEYLEANQVAIHFLFPSEE